MVRKQKIQNFRNRSEWLEMFTHRLEWFEANGERYALFIFKPEFLLFFSAKSTFNRLQRR